MDVRKTPEKGIRIGLEGKDQARADRLGCGDWPRGRVGQRRLWHREVPPALRAFVSPGILPRYPQEQSHSGSCQWSPHVPRQEALPCGTHMIPRNAGMPPDQERSPGNAGFRRHSEQNSPAVERLHSSERPAAPSQARPHVAFPGPIPSYTEPGLMHHPCPKAPIPLPCAASQAPKDEAATFSLPHFPPGSSPGDSRGH